MYLISAASYIRLLRRESCCVKIFVIFPIANLKVVLVAVLLISITLKFVEAARDSLYCQATFMVSVVFAKTPYP